MLRRLLLAASVALVVTGCANAPTTVAAPPSSSVPTTTPAATITTTPRTAADDQETIFVALVAQYVPVGFNSSIYANTVCSRFSESETTGEILDRLVGLGLTRAGARKFMGLSVTFHCQQYLQRMTEGAIADLKVHPGE